MSETRTTSMLQRVPVILAVTAASYGLTLHGRNDMQAQPHKASTQQKAAQSERGRAPGR
jgi:hypothetical protein